MNHPNETSLYNAADTVIRVNSNGNEQPPNPASEIRIHDVPSSSQQHTINIDVISNINADSPIMQQNFLSFLHEARSHLGVRPVNLQTIANNNDHQHHHPESEDSNVNRWRVNLNNVLSFSAGPSTETIRSWIPRSGTFRYMPLNRSSSVTHDTPAVVDNEAAPATNDVVINLSTTGTPAYVNESNQAIQEPRIPSIARISLLRTNSVDPPAATDGPAGAQYPEPGTLPAQPSTNGAHRTPPTPPNEVDEDNVFYELCVKLLSHFVRYLPFIGIVLIKSLFDHCVGIADILVLHTVVYQVNKSLCQQVAKLSQKSLSLLFRDCLLVTIIVVYRFMIGNRQPDFLGLLLNSADDPRSLIQLLHAVAVNDLLLKLITINIKILVTALPVNVIKHKPRARLYALIEAISQMYRSLVPVKSWLVYLLISYTGWDIIVGMFFFFSLYIGAKVLEFCERFKFLKKAFCNFLRNVEFGRKPTKEELNDAGAVCPICHDNYDTPIVLECNHIFCEVCVGTWFKREQTCPLCRAKVADDPIWQNGSTTLFYQLC